MSAEKRRSQTSQTAATEEGVTIFCNHQLENNFGSDLDVARSGYGAVPKSEGGARYIIIDRESEAAVGIYGEGMPVPNVESIHPDFDADFFSHSRGFADPEVLVVIAKRAVVGDAGPLPEVKVKVADRLEGSPVKQRSQPGVETSKLGKRAGSRQDAGNAARRELIGYIAESRAEEKRRAGLIAENGARLPASHHVVEDAASAQEALPGAEGQVVNQRQGEHLRHVISG